MKSRNQGSAKAAYLYAIHRKQYGEALEIAKSAKFNLNNSMAIYSAGKKLSYRCDLFSQLLVGNDTAKTNFLDELFKLKNFDLDMGDNIANLLHRACYQNDIKYVDKCIEWFKGDKEKLKAFVNRKTIFFEGISESPFSLLIFQSNSEKVKIIAEKLLMAGADPYFYRTVDNIDRRIFTYLAKEEPINDNIKYYFSVIERDTKQLKKYLSRKIPMAQNRGANAIEELSGSALSFIFSLSKNQFPMVTASTSPAELVHIRDRWLMFYERSHVFQDFIVKHADLFDDEFLKIANIMLCSIRLDLFPQMNIVNLQMGESEKSKIIRSCNHQIDGMRKSSFINLSKFKIVPDEANNLLAELKGFAIMKNIKNDDERDIPTLQAELSKLIENLNRMQAVENRLLSVLNAANPKDQIATAIEETDFPAQKPKSKKPVLKLKPEPEPADITPAHTASIIKQRDRKQEIDILNQSLEMAQKQAADYLVQIGDDVDGYDELARMSKELSQIEKMVLGENETTDETLKRCDEYHVIIRKLQANINHQYKACASLQSKQLLQNLKFTEEDVEDLKVVEPMLPAVSSSSASNSANLETANTKAPDLRTGEGIRVIPARKLFDTKPPKKLEKSNFPARDILQDCLEKINKLRSLNNAYQKQGPVQNGSLVYDAFSAINVSAMQSMILALYESLLLLQKNPSEAISKSSIFKDVETATKWRDMSKYIYVFVFSHEANHFSSLIKGTLDLVYNAVKNRLDGREISRISKEQMPVASNVLEKPEEATWDLLRARYINILTLVKTFNKKNTIDPLELENMARAKLFCLGLMGQIMKEIQREHSDRLSPIKPYDYRLKQKVLDDTSYTQFETELELEQTPALLNYFAHAARTPGGIERINDIITALSMNDMAKMLKEIINTISHRVDSPWAQLTNSRIYEVIGLIAKKCIEYHPNEEDILLSPIIFNNPRHNR